jgi:parvulin-like peptidyl-prolyl isomerase
VIKIGFKESGGREEAAAKAKAVRDRSVKGEDFALLAGSANTDARLARNGGDPTGDGSFIDRGAFANQKLEEAIWAVQPGQLTPVVESPDAYYVAKLEEKKAGRIKPFDDEEVQAQIRKNLEAEQFGALRDRVVNQLMKNAIVFPEPPRYEPALEMAMQRYPVWAGKK